MADRNTRQGNFQFELEVRRAAEAVWGLPKFSCQSKSYPAGSGLDELDGYVEEPRGIHLIMITVSTKLDKIQSDVKKLQAAKKFERQRNPMRQYSLWIITKEKLPAAQLRHAYDNDVVPFTLDEFRTSFFDGQDYVGKRRLGAFGSVRNLQDETITLPEDAYVPLPMEYQYLNPQNSSRQELPIREINLDEIVSKLTKGEIVILTAPFGSGKSLTTREIFYLLEKAFRNGANKRVPLVLNLREHTNHKDAATILQSHGKSIGFSPTENLVVGWRAGLATLLIDGFDEVASVVVSSIDKSKNYMRKARRESLEGVRNLVSQSPSGVGILFCGRDHYFDDTQEMMQALGINSRPCTLIRLGEFNDDQLIIFLDKHGINKDIPDWLPRKPLLLSYLAQNPKLMRKVLEIGPADSFGFAWTRFLDVICSREARPESAVMEPDAVRRVLEKLSCLVRATSSGTGPITEQNLIQVYESEGGVLEDDRVRNQLQRLPGLTARGQRPGSRSFVDEDFLAALQGSAVVNILQGNLKIENDAQWQYSLSSKGISMASYSLKMLGWTEAQVMDYFQQYIYRGQVAADCFMIALDMANEQGFFNGRGHIISGRTIGRIDLEEVYIENVTFSNCIIEEVVLGPSILKQSVRFIKCTIGRVFGVTSAEALPTSIFDSCDCLVVDKLPNSNAILSSNLPNSLKALLTVLRKVYLQPGSGRQLNALRRGVIVSEVESLIEPITRILESEKIINVTSQGVFPIRKHQKRVERIFEELQLSQDPILLRVRELYSS